MFTPNPKRSTVVLLCTTKLNQTRLLGRTQRSIGEAGGVGCVWRGGGASALLPRTSSDTHRVAGLPHGVRCLWTPHSARSTFRALSPLTFALRFPGMHMASRPCVPCMCRMPKKKSSWFGLGVSVRTTLPPLRRTYARVPPTTLGRNCESAHNDAQQLFAECTG